MEIDATTRDAPEVSIDRYYDPSTGQFLSVDPDVATTGQAYAYTGDDPVNGVDPMGLCNGVLGCITTGFDTARHAVATGADTTKAALGSIASLQTQADEQQYEATLCDPLGTLSETAGAFAAGALPQGAFEAAFGAAASTGPEFAGGEAYETSLTTSDGEVGIMGDVEVDGSTLTIKNLAIYSDQGDVPNQVGASTFLSVIRQIATQAEDSGFSTLRIQGVRALTSSSSAPGKVVNIVVDLTKG